jgi:hypothetical protein
MSIHQRAIFGIYMALGLYLGVRSIIDFEETRSEFFAFFSGWPLYYSYLALTVVMLVPVSCFAIAYFIAKRHRNLIVIVPLVHTFLFFPVGVLLAIYSGYWLWKARDAHAA